MAATEHYRARAQEVRRAARARLAEIRAERAARTGRAGPADIVDDVGPAPSGLKASGAAAALAAAALAQTDIAHADLEVIEASGALESEPETAPSIAAAPDDWSLDRLPGIGPGLIWILERGGVNDLRDLAACTPEELRARVGVLGSLVNVDAWVAFARDAAAGADRAA